jgi:predicted O-linked N-acetylglucosamine transferase (SPINDLY family)
MGVPTLTIMGKTQPGRAGAGLLRNVGLDEFIAHDMEDFVSKGLCLAQDINSLVKVRAGLRLRFKQSPRGQPELIANGLEQIFRLMWQRWCADLTPIDLDMSHLHSAHTLTQGE